MLYLLGERVCICGSFKSESQQISNPQSVTFAEGPQIYQII
jgi:hypothetical protein